MEFARAGTRGNQKPSCEFPSQAGQMKYCEAMTRILLSRPWSDDDINALRKLWADGVPVRKLALRFRRSQSAIRGKAVQLGLKRPIQAARPLPEGQMHAH
jgi:hypothetical protein